MTQSPTCGAPLKDALLGHYTTFSKDTRGIRRVLD